MVFIFYKIEKKIKSGIVFHDMWKLYEIYISVSILNIMGRQPHSFTGVSPVDTFV